ncbi:hypothetical protein L3X38_029213 [Prunus dulcis]|uniref:DUF7788 domain-containing protein n=1 Tax=Prunus dulcis TaxID=3755 RepID=A0AAD4VS69_PRUDU|nr:hypothetical protein L3X38_029213 [Prunus dulcis]
MHVEIECIQGTAGARKRESHHVEKNHQLYLNLEIDYHAIYSKYQEKGYGDVVPQMVFWTLSKNNPEKLVAPSTQPGVFILMASSTICSSSSSTVKAKLAPTIS